MDNNTIRINSYLQNEMNDEERKSFEAELLINTDLRQETEMQKHITAAAFNAGVKNEFAKAMQRKVFSGRIIRFD